MKNKMRIGAVVQARTSSTRLPNKVLKELPYASGITVLQQVVRRLKKVSSLDDIIVATSTDKADEKIIELAEKENVLWFRGSLNNVLERYYLAAKENDLDVIVRITSDCPCIDPHVIDFILEEHFEAASDYSFNDMPATYPHGLDVEVVDFAALENSYNNAESSYDKEHVCSYIYKTNPGAFNIQTIRAPKHLTSPEIRVTIDRPEDYTLLCAVFDYLYPVNKFFSTRDIIELFQDKPWLKMINRVVSADRS